MEIVCPGEAGEVVEEDEEAEGEISPALIQPCCVGAIKACDLIQSTIIHHLILNKLWDQFSTSRGMEEVAGEGAAIKALEGLLRLRQAGLQWQDNSLQKYWDDIQEYSRISFELMSAVERTNYFRQENLS